MTRYVVAGWVAGVLTVVALIGLLYISLGTAHI